MKNNTKDDTLKKNYIQKYQFLIKEYELVKTKKHPTFQYVKEFYTHHGTCPQTFLKYYGRHKNSECDQNTLISQKRDPKFKIRRTSTDIEILVLNEREKGTNKYEINHILEPRLKEKTPSPSTIFNILKRHGEK